MHLGLICHLAYKTADRERRIVDKPMVYALVAHVAGEDASVCGESRDSNTHVVINLEDLTGGKARSQA